jgi:hypothetical protein
MNWQQSTASRRVSSLLTCTICCAVALAILSAAPDARAQDLSQNTPAAAASSNPFSRWFGAPSATATPAATQPVQRVRKMRVAKSKKRTAPVAVQAAPAQEQSAPPAQAAPPAQQQTAESGWPNAEANVGGAMIAPLTIKTVREMVEPEAPVVLENEISDIDRAAQPAIAAASESPASAASTDGSAAIENDVMEQTRVLAMGETMRAMLQSAWFEPILLMLAGAVAALSAARVFA